MSAQGIQAEPQPLRRRFCFRFPLKLFRIRKAPGSAHCTAIIRAMYQQAT